MVDRTIAAISTPLGPGGIGIIRVSGPNAYNILQRLFVRRTRRKTKQPASEVRSPFDSHRFYYGHIRDSKSGAIIDEVLAVYMQGPKSFTREDVVEIHAHSGYVVLDRLLNAVIDAGADLANPGEFIKRAFLNGRIDLSQAEAVIDIINAPCETALQMASQQVFGGLRDALSPITAALYQLRAQCEAAIEFPDEVDSTDDLEVVHTMLRTTILDPTNALIQKQKDTAIFRDGLLLAIYGVPNVGKSSLLNKLVDRETAIVSEMPGTTRDVIREYCSIRGVPVVICDTAGIQNTDDPVERIGIEKAKDQVKQADVVLLVTEATRDLNPFEVTMIDEVKSSQAIVVINKNDLATPETITRISSSLLDIPHVVVSAKYGSGIEALKKMIFKGMVSKEQAIDSQIVAPNLRHRRILENAKLIIVNYLAEGDHTVELASNMINNVILLFEDIVGTRENDALYDDIFNQFCIGK